MNKAPFAVAALFLAGLAAAEGATQPQVGVAGAAKAKVTAQAHGVAVGRIINSGMPLYLNDHVRTDEHGRLQVMLLDETVFTMGPRSDIVLDEFVYDPKTNKGVISAKIERGVFRFVTGRIGHKKPENMKVRLPVGTIGVRGTIVGGEVGEKGRSLVVLYQGGIDVSNTAGSVSISRIGFGTVIDGPTSAPSQPGLIPANVREAIDSALAAAASAVGPQTSAANYALPPYLNDAAPIPEQAKAQSTPSAVENALSPADLEKNSAPEVDPLQLMPPDSVAAPAPANAPPPNP